MLDRNVYRSGSLKPLLRMKPFRVLLRKELYMEDYTTIPYKSSVKVDMVIDRNGCVSPQSECNNIMYHA